MKKSSNARSALVPMIVGAYLVACGGEKSTQPAPVIPPASLRLVIPDTVTRGQAFSLTVAALDGQGQTNSTWTGPIALSTSSGSISPTSVDVVNGAATVQVTIGQATGAVTITSTVGNASNSHTTLVFSEQATARLEIHPQTFMLAGVGATQALRVIALDAGGLPTATVAVTWESSRTRVASVSAAGVASGNETGSASITARAGTIASAPALAYVTTPAAGVLLVPDEQITSGITPVNPQARYGLGWQYRVRMTGPPPQVGQVLASRGEKPVAGRVVAVQSAGAAGNDVTLQLVTLDQVFPNLSIHETGTLRIEPEMKSYFHAGTHLPWAAIVDTTFTRGPFKCQTKLETVENNPFALSGISNELTSTLQYEWIYTATRKRLVVDGGLTGSFKVTPTVTAALNGSIECKARVGQPIPIPIGGALSLFFGARVVVGGGFALEGGITLATLGFDIEASAGATLSMGYDCNPDCANATIFNLTGSSSGSVKPNLPQISSDFRVTAGVSGFAWADLEVGPSDLIPGAENLRVTLVEAKAGLKQEFNLSTADVQSVDPAYASSYSLAPFFSGGIPSDVQGPLDSLLAIVMVAIPPLRYEASGTPIAQSPAGFFQIVPARVMAATASSPGDTATFIVNLSRTNYLSQYAVESVKLFRKPSASGSLVPAPGSCASLTPTTAQSLFTCKTDLPISMAGEQTFYAFVKPIFGVALPVLLEVAPDGKGTVTVDTVRVVYSNDFSGAVGTEWSRQNVTQSPGGQSPQRFLGLFQLGDVVLSLNNVPAHNSVTIEFDFHTIHDWEGSASPATGGPDIMSFLVDGQSVLRTSFSTKPGFSQAYPGTYPNATNSPMAGATALGALGYPNGSGHRGDATYRLSFTVPHTVSSIQFRLRHESDGEDWGIDNIRVTVR